MSIMIMKKVIPEVLRSSMFEKVTTTKEFFAKIEHRFVKNGKVEISMPFFIFLSLYLPL